MSPTYFLPAPVVPAIDWCSELSLSAGSPVCVPTAPQQHQHHSTTTPPTQVTHVTRSFATKFPR